MSTSSSCGKCRLSSYIYDNQPFLLRTEAESTSARNLLPYLPYKCWISQSVLDRSGGNISNSWPGVKCWCQFVFEKNKSCKKQNNTHTHTQYSSHHDSVSLMNRAKLSHKPALSKLHEAMTCGTRTGVTGFHNPPFFIWISFFVKKKKFGTLSNTPVAYMYISCILFWRHIINMINDDDFRFLMLRLSDWLTERLKTDQTVVWVNYFNANRFVFLFKYFQWR